MLPDTAGTPPRRSLELGDRGEPLVLLICLCSAITCVVWKSDFNGGLLDYGVLVGGATVFGIVKVSMKKKIQRSLFRR
jgi:hypothetical protein